MNRKENFTKAALTRLSCPQDSRSGLYVYDAKTRGLAVRVSPGGTKTFLLYRKVQGRPERITIGHFPDWTIEQARGRAAELNALLAQGEDPANRTGTVNDKTTLGALFDLYLERHAKVHKLSWKNDEWQFHRHCGAWKTYPLASITRAAVQALHAKIRQRRGPYAANRVLALLRKVFNCAIDWGFKGQNPVARVKMFKEQSRTRFLGPEELTRFMDALLHFPNEAYRDLFLLALLTGARQSNVRSMRWKEMDFGQAMWTIPSTKTKNRESVSIPLVPEAVEVLKTRREAADSEWVFPSKTSGSGHVEDLRHPWAVLCEKAEVKELRVHDLRRTLGSWEAATGASLPIIGKTLGHLDQNSTAVYARLNVEPVRRAMETATAAMLEQAGVRKPRTKVVEVDGTG